MMTVCRFQPAVRVESVRRTFSQPREEKTNPASRLSARTLGSLILLSDQTSFLDAGSHLSFPSGRSGLRVRYSPSLYCHP